MSDILIKNIKLPKGNPCRLTLYAEGGAIQHLEDKSVIVGKWKALEPHGRLIDADKLLKELSDCEMKSYGYNGSCDDCEDRNICRVKGLLKDIEDAPTVLEASE